MSASNSSACIKCGWFAHGRICKNRSCVVGTENLILIEHEREENLKVLLRLRIMFGVFQTPTHSCKPHDHQDAKDMTSRGFSGGARATYRQIYVPRSNFNHYMEVVVFAPMRSDPDPDRNALLAWQAFNGMDWSSHEVPLHKVLTLIREHQDQEEKLFFLTVDVKTRPGQWNERDRF